MTKTIRKKADLKKIIKRLEKVKSKNCQILSVYVPSGFDIKIIVKQLEAEKSYVEQNLKKNKRNILETLNNTIKTTKSIKKNYKNGCVIFVGKLKQSFISEIVIPPQDINLRLYRCDMEFLLKPLKDIIK